MFVSKSQKGALLVWFVNFKKWAENFSFPILLRLSERTQILWDAWNFEGTWLKGGVGRDLFKVVWIKGHDVWFDSDFLLIQGGVRRDLF